MKLLDIALMAVGAYFLSGVVKGETPLAKSVAAAAPTAQDYGYGPGLGSHGEPILGDILFPARAPVRGTSGCMGDGRGMIDVYGAPNTHFQVCGPWGCFIAQGYWIEPSGHTCITVDGCWGGTFTVSPDVGRATPGSFSLTTWNTAENACYQKVVIS